MKVKEVKTDVLIIGSGAAGLRTALEVNSLKKDCLVIGKCELGDAHTTLATGGINAALANMDPEDSVELHAADTIKEGWFLADQKTVEQLCKEAPRAIKDLESYGMKFQREKDGRITQRFFGAALYRRACFSGDETGKEILRSLVEEVKKKKIKFQDNVYVTKLFKKKGRVIGALGLDLKKGEFYYFKAKAVVLAMGGYSRVYRRSSSRIMENTGDGVALGYDAGAELQDMEMTQFHPTGMIWPPDAEGVLVTEAVRGEGGKLYNAKGERFMERYDPRRKELGPRDEVARAIYKEIQSGNGTTHGGVFLDVTHLSKEYILERLPKAYRQFKEFLGIDISTNKMEVAPTSHYSMGGLRVRFSDMQTKVPGLFAVGEVTGGLHGANRLGGNSLLECIVFGKHAGIGAVNSAKKGKIEAPDAKEVEKEINKIKTFIGHKSTGSVKNLRGSVQENMWKNVGIIRTEKELKTASRNLEQIKMRASRHVVYGRLDGNEDLAIILDVKNMLVACEAVIRSALLREESRGAHERSDFPKKNDKLLGSFVCYKGEYGMKVDFKPQKKVTGKLLNALKVVEKAKYHHLE